MYVERFEFRTDRGLVRESGLARLALRVRGVAVPVRRRELRGAVGRRSAEPTGRRSAVSAVAVGRDAGNRVSGRAVGANLARGEARALLRLGPALRALLRLGPSSRSNLETQKNLT